jgi:hypothetical protein
MIKPAYRFLRGYCLDPGFSTRLDTASINEGIYRIPFEVLKPGPIGEYVEVIDFDPASDCWYDPVDLGDEEIASQYGLPPSEGNPQFHQQFVYAVAMKTIVTFERALGRKIIWYPRRSPRLSYERYSRRFNLRLTHEGRLKGLPAGLLSEGYVARLRLHPHALRDANAYYDPEKQAVLFGYFVAADQFQGANYPGGLVFTCLSPDIVAHEMTHAILEAIHPRYMEDTNPDVAAFHEGFADIVALLQRFTFSEMVEQQLAMTAGRLDRYNVLGELATQFGEALAGNRGALRSMIGRWTTKDGKEEWEPLKPSPADYATTVEAHDRGALLVATIFDAFQRVYAYSTRDLLRIASNGTGVLPEGSISRELVHRLAEEAREVAEHLLQICIRALDYCPPHDITFGDYLRALITADIDAAPADDKGYRVALIEAFRARGIFPEGVKTLSVDSLRWSGPDFTNKQTKMLSSVINEIKQHIRLLVEATDRHKVYELLRESQLVCQKALLFNTQKAFKEREWEDFLNKLGLTRRPVSKLFGLDSASVRFQPNNSYVPPIEVGAVRPAFRASREEGRQIEQVLVTLTQRVLAEIGEDGERKPMLFRGGCSLVLRLGTSNEAEYVVGTSIKSYGRFERQRKYLLGEGEGPGPSASLYADDDRPWRINFNLLHRHRG